MASERDDDGTLQLLLDRLQAGDPAAPGEILTRAIDRFRRLAARMMAQETALRRFEQTDDLLQNVAIRMHRALQTERPQTPEALFGLAALQIRRELVDMGRHHFGPEGEAAHHVSDPGAAADSRPPLHEAVGGTGPSTLLQWQEFHTQVQSLPEEERQVFDLIFYHELQQHETAQILGVSTETVKRRWRNAKLLLDQVMQACPPLH